MHRYQNRLCVPSVNELRSNILEEVHGSMYSIPPGATKMYYDLKEVYWWEGMNADVFKLVE